MSFLSCGCLAVTFEPPLTNEPVACLWRFARRHVRLWLWSVVCGIVVAVLWSGALVLTFPVIKSFLQGQHLSEYVGEELAAAELDALALEHELTSIQARAAELETTSPIASKAMARVLADQDRVQRRLSVAADRIARFAWLQSTVIPRLPRDAFSLLALFLGILVVATALKGLFIFLQDQLVSIVAERTVMDVRKALYRRLLQLDPQSVALNGQPQWLARFHHDLQLVTSGITLVAGDIVREPLKAVACLVAAFYFNWRLTLLAALVVPVAGVLFLLFSRRLKRATTRLLDSMTRLYQVLHETFDSLKIVIAFHGTPQLRRRFYKENRQYLAKARKLVRIDALSGPVTEMLGMTAIFVAVVPAAYLVLRGETDIAGIDLTSKPMDIAELSVLYASLAGCLDSVRKFSRYFPKLKRSLTAAERVFQTMHQPSLVPLPVRPALFSPPDVAVEFREVSFRYASPESLAGMAGPPASATSPQAGTPGHDVLRQLNLRLEAGTTTAIVGSNGCGKSTLLGLLMRFYDPTEGSVLVDGVDLRTVRPRDLRARIAVVSQETQLFAGTIAENIRYGRPEASRDEVIRAAARARVLEFSEQLPEGLETAIGQQGRQLSGGQRQRIALARAMLRDPAILLLDEPTSAIDALSAELIQEALAEFVRGRTTLWITHAFSAQMLPVIQRTVVLDRGRVIADGSHSQLLESCPLYAQLFGSSGSDLTSRGGSPAVDARAAA